MAIAQPAPVGEPEPLPDDLVTAEECVEMYRDSPYPVSLSTAKRLMRRNRLRTWRRGRANVVSYTDFMEAHREWAKGQEPSGPDY